MFDVFFLIYFVLSLFSIAWSLLGLFKTISKNRQPVKVDRIKKPLPVTDEVTDEDIFTAMPVNKKEK